MPGKRWVFTTRVEPISPPYKLAGLIQTTRLRRFVIRTAGPKPLKSLERSANLVEAPGTAPGSTMFIPRTVYHHSRQAGRTYIGATRRM